MLDVVDTLDVPTTRFVQEAERRRLARDLHDGVVQSLTALVMDLEYFRMRCHSTTDEAMNAQVAEKIERWRELARDSLTSMRQALGDLRTPDEIGEAGLRHAISTKLAEMQRAGYRVEIECEDWPPVLPFEYTFNIYYIVREALTNIQKHAGASTITVYMFSFEEHLYISVADDGVGMAKHRCVAQRRSGYHQGMVGMRERAALLGGRVNIDSEAGRGTRVDINVPLPFDASAEA